VALAVFTVFSRFFGIYKGGKLLARLYDAHGAYLLFGA